MKRIVIYIAILAVAGFASFGWDKATGSESESAGDKLSIKEFTAESIWIYTKDGFKTDKKQFETEASFPLRVRAISPLGLLAVEIDGKEVWLERTGVILNKDYRPCPKVAQSREANSRVAGSQAYSSC